MKGTTTIYIGYPSGIPHTSVDAVTGEQVTQDTAELAEKLSVGDAALPARPHLYEGLMFGMRSIKKEITQYFKNKQQGKDTIEDVALVAERAVRDYVDSTEFKEAYRNADYTVKKKGRNQPLVDTGEMVKSLTHIVEKG